MLGVAVVQQLRADGFEVLAPRRADFDAAGDAPSRLPIMEVDAVVNALGMVNRRLDAGEGAFLRVNSLFPRRLADACEAAGRPLIHVSSDCVFGGQGAPHDESVTPDAHDLYGQSKAWGEPRNALTIRTSIIGPEPARYYSLLCWLLAQRGEVPGYVNHHWNGVTTLALAAAISAIWRKGLWQPGIRHVFSDDVTKHDLLVALATVFHHPVTVRADRGAVARDMRLATCHNDWLTQLDLPPLREQVARLPDYCDALGHWRDPGASQ